MDSLRAAAEMALEALDSCEFDYDNEERQVRTFDALLVNAAHRALHEALAQPDVTMADAVAAGNSVLLNEQAALLRECRAALDSLIKQKPTLAGLLCGSTTLGNLKAELHAHRPQGIFGEQA